MGRLLAQRLGFRFLDTGAMYRAVTLAALRKGIDLADEAALTRLADSLELRLVPGDSGDRLLMDGEDVTDLLRQQKVERGVSLVARVPGVRAAMVRQQQAIAREGPVVMVGRDIGTVVLPDARVKVFLKASVDVRPGACRQTTRRCGPTCSAATSWTPSAPPRRCGQQRSRSR